MGIFGRLRKRVSRGIDHVVEEARGNASGSLDVAKIDLSLLRKWREHKAREIKRTQVTGSVRRQGISSYGFVPVRRSRCHRSSGG